MGSQNKFSIDPIVKLEIEKICNRYKEEDIVNYV